MHEYIIGATRSGKTNYMLSELPESRFAFIDKHGTAARQIADAMHCIYWRPADLDHVVALNPLQNVTPDDRWKVTADIVSVFQRYLATRARNASTVVPSAGIGAPAA